MWLDLQVRRRLQAAGQDFVLDVSLQCTQRQVVLFGPSGAGKSLTLKAVAGLVRPGGRLVYCTCSLEPEEGEQVVESALADTTELRRVPITPSEVAGLAELITEAGDLRTLPCHLPHQDPRLGGLDGFYAARLERRP